MIFKFLKNNPLSGGGGGAINSNNLPAGKGLTSWLSFVVSNCEFVTFPLVSYVRCGTLLYRFLIFAPLLTLFDFGFARRHIQFSEF